MTRSRLLLTAGAGVCVFAVLGCAWLARRQAVRRCEFQLEGVKPVDYSILDPLHVDLEITIRSRNPNGVDALLEPFRWQLLVGEAEIAEGRRGDSVLIPAHAEVSFTMAVEADLWEGAKSLVTAILDGQASYRVPGVVYLSTPLGDIEYDVVIEEGRWTSEKGFESTAARH